MIDCGTRKWGALFLVAACCAFFPVYAYANQSLGLKLDSPYRLSSHRTLKSKAQGTLNLQGYYPTANSRLYNNIDQEFQFESFDAPILIKSEVLGENILPPMVFRFDDYQTYLQHEQMENAWQEYVVKNMTESDESSRGAGGINLDIPVKIKSKAFQKIFGSGTVGLNVTGDIRIQAGLRREDRSEVRTALTRGASTNFKMQQTQRFAVTGKIGDKVTINVDQDSERAFEFDNNVKLLYQGYDDEILQRLEAGNISLSLPGTRYVTFSGKNSGLFGIKSEMVLGNLNVTTIASQEKGESQKLTLTGGASEGTKMVKDYQYLENVYFFVDSTFREQYRYFDAQGNHVNLPSVPEIDEATFEVYKAAAGYETQFPDKNIPGWALADGTVNSPADTSSVVFGDAEFGHFIRLEKNEYFLENTLGYIRMNTPVAQGEILAVAYRTTDGRTYGDVTRSDTARSTIILKLIKSQNQLPSNKTWDLAWKHVYSLGGRNIDEDGFDLKIFFNPPSGPDQETDASGRKWLQVFGLDDKNQSGTPNNPDGKIDLDGNILDLGNGELHFRDLQPFDPIGYFVNGQPVNIELPEDKKISAIYDTTDTRIITAASKFYLEVTSKNRSTDYNLGFNVIENSEVVRLDGQELTRGVDYSIDYFSGQLTILDERATNPNSKLDVTYERNQLFQLEKKTILGMRAEYDMGRDSYIGSTLLYLNQSTLDRKVRVGRGPMRNMVWDMNARFRLNPNFIGSALDFLPFIRAKGETNMNIEGEIAQVLPTPNTLNNSRTGDNSGVAYIDDFEASKKTVSLGIIRRNWTQASQPADGRHTFVNKINNFVWYNPYDQVPLQEIYPERDLNPNVPNQTHVLTFELFSDPNESQPDPKRWNGVMRALSAGYFDQSQTKFIEIMVQGDVGRLHIDLGRISEDALPDNRLNTEDKQVAGIRNGILDPGEDIGIDGVEKPDPPLNFPRSNFEGQPVDEVPYDFWDVNRNGIKDADEPWSYDDWFYTNSDPRTYDQRNAANFSSISGTQNNANDEGGRLPDTEDINGNGIMDPTNNYFSYSFSLSPTDPDTTLIVGGNPNAHGGPWKLYRIPFTEGAADSIVGVPQITQIEYVRIWFDELDFSNRETVRASIAEINLVGSEWQELGITGNEFDLSTASIIPNDTTVAVTQINTHENASYAASLSDIGVEGEEDPVTRVRAREQSLVLVAHNLPARIAGIAQKSLFQGENYIHYNRIRMFVHGTDNFNTHIPADTSQPSYLEYFVRFGADNNNYYEYRSTIYQGWNDFNHMDVGIQDFTNINRTDSTNYDPVTDTFVQYLTPDRSKSIRVKGTPSFTNVKILMLGLKNIHPQLMPFDGEVWFNELRLSDVEKEKGMAMRVRSDIRIADFANVNGEVEKMDADFHNVATRFGTGDNRLSSSLNANINLDKMLPQFLGVSMPLNLTYRKSSSSPKYFPGQDRLVSDNLAEAELDLVRSRSTQTGFNVSFRRQAQSKNFFIKNTFDNMSFSIGRSKNHLENPTTTFSDAESWTGNFDYRLDFGRNNFFSPLGWLPNLPLVNKLKTTRFYYTPQNVAFKVNGTRTLQSSQNRILNSTQEAPVTSTESFFIDRSVRTNMKIFESLTVDFSRTHKADMRGHTLSDFFNWNFDDVNIAQTFSARYNPQIFSWLSNNFSYSSNYVFNNNIQQQLTGRSARNSVTRSADFTFQWKQLVKSIFGEGKRVRRPPPGSQGRERPGGNGQMKIFQQSDEGGGSFNPLRLVGSFFSNFKDISMNYSERTNLSHLGLQEGTPSWGFQFGLSDTTGIGTVPELSTNSISLSENKTLSLGSGIAFGRAIDVGLRFQHSDQRNQSTIITGSSSDSHLKFKGFDLPFPEWTVRITGLEKFPLFNKLFQTVSFSHGFSGQKDVTWSGTPENATQENITTNFRPLGKLDLNFKNGFTGSIQLNRAITLSRNLVGGIGARRTTNQDISVTANYSKRSGFKLPFWPFNKAELKNSIDFSFSFTASNVVTEQSRTQTDGADQFEEQDKTQRWSFSPRVTYSFSNRVRGGAFIEVGQTNSKRVGKTSIQEFGLDINIAIRGN